MGGRAGGSEDYTLRGASGGSIAQATAGHARKEA